MNRISNPSELIAPCFSLAPIHIVDRAQIIPPSPYPPLNISLLSSRTSTPSHKPYSVGMRSCKAQANI